MAEVPPADCKGKGKKQADPFPTARKGKGKTQADLLPPTRPIESILEQAMSRLNKQLDAINKGLKIVTEEMRASFVLAIET
ncbi:hypothetical protein C0989_009588 [Termitomyces sp. Mn162]|nr:hypothetical protein C0989_009588 [Termitomyces sp. Mn162]